MNRVLTAALINNAAMLLALSVIYEISYFLPLKYKKVRPVINGLLITFICLLIMSMPFTLIPGVVFDTRSILISVTALTFGTVSTVITSFFAIVYRVITGGIGVVPGITSIISSALIGLAWRHITLKKFKRRRWLSIYIMSITVHAVMLCSMLFLPYPDNIAVIKEIAAPVMIIYPVAALMLSLLLLRQQEHKQYQQQLADSEEKHRLLFETMTQGVVYQAADGEIISANSAAERILGLTFDRMQGRTSMDPAWHSIREDGSVLPGSEHPAMIALRTGKKVGPVVMGIYQPQINDIVWLSVNAIPLYKPGEANPFQAYATFDDITAERNANQNYRLLFNKMIDGFALHEIILNAQGNPADYRFLAVNPTFESLVGKKAEEIVGRTVLEIFPETEPGWIETYGRVALTGEPAEFTDYSAALGKYFEVSAYRPAPNQFACTFSDITERVRAETQAAESLSRLKESEAKYSSYIASAPYGIVVIDQNGRFIEANNAASAISGYSKEELIQMNFKDIIDENSMEQAAEHSKILYDTGTSSVLLNYKHKNNTIRSAMTDAVKLYDNRYLCFVTDVTDRKKAEDELIYLIYHDYLTGLYNRKYFEEAKTRLDKEEYLPLSVLIADINGVRLINDSLGYAEGDKLITETSQILKSCCRPDDVLARIGGDEFTMILPNTDSVTAYAILKKIDDACEFYNKNNKSGFYEINLSAGFGTKENLNEDIADITKIADVYLRNKKLMNSRSFRNNLISSMMATVYEKSQETEEHAKRMTELTKKVGEKLNLPQKNLAELELLSVLHDIGKIGIDDSILNKPGNLTDNEWIIMKTHPEVGYRIAKSTSELEPIAELILTHHERWDGKGYPSGLAGEAIPLLSRIIAVVDAYDAMTNDRIYRKAMTEEDAIKEIKDNAGIQFDPVVVDVFAELLKEESGTGQAPAGDV